MSEVVSSPGWCLGREAVFTTWCGRWRRCLGCSNFPIDSIQTFGCHLNRKCRCVMFCNRLGLTPCLWILKRMSYGAIPPRQHFGYIFA